MCDHLAVDLKRTAKENDYFRRVLFTSNDLQVVIMSLRPGEETCCEVHRSAQFMYVFHGEGMVYLKDADYKVCKGVGLALPGNHPHAIKNMCNDELKFVVVYGPKRLSSCLVEYTDPVCMERQVIRK